MFNPYDSQFHADPYPFFEQLRAQEPLHSTIFQTLIVSSYGYAEAFLKDHRFLPAHLPILLERKASDYHEASFLQISNLVRNWIVFLSPPDHSRLRTAINPAFTQEAIEMMGPYVESTVANLLHGLPTGSPVDLISDLADPLLAQTITRLLGLPICDAKEVYSWVPTLYKSLTSRLR